MKSIIGIDIGTTNIKITAFSLMGKQLYSFSKKNKIYDSKDGYDFDKEYIFSCVLIMLQKIIANDLEILSIGISSFAETLIPVIRKNINYSRTMVWYDRRTEKQKDDFFNKFDPEYFFKITGLKPEYLHSIHKLSWYKENNSGMFNKVYKWLPANSYIAYKLTGELAMDYTLACRTGALNIKERKWSEDILSILPFTDNVFPPLIDSGKKIGNLSNEMKNKLQIDYDIPVALGGHDHICGSYAVAAYRDNVILDSMGTAENIQAIVDIADINMNQLWQLDINIGAHVIPEMGYIYDTFDYSGAVIDFLISLFLNKNKEKLTEKDYNIFCREARNYVNQKSNIKLYINQNDRRNKYKLNNINFLNISLSTKRGEIFLAGIHHISEKSKEIIKVLEKIIDEQLDIIAIGGSTRNSLLMKEKARILNRDVYITKIDKAVTLGAALLGSLAGDYYDNYKMAVTNIIGDSKKVSI